MTFLRQGSLWGLVLLAGLALAHGGHEAVPEGEPISLEPIVRGLYSGYPVATITALSEWLC
jgi:hypothetical protein